MKFGLLLAYLKPPGWVEACTTADRLGFESAWCSEHLVFPVRMHGSPSGGADHPPVRATTPAFDSLAVLGHLAAHTTRLRLGTSIYLLGLRHPFAAARSVTTTDVLSGGRLELGLGVGWLESEFTAAGVDFTTRGARFDEALDVCQRLWTEEIVEHHGRFWDFEPVYFEPKPVQSPVPITIGGESDAALRRVVRAGDGWMGMEHTPETAAASIQRLHQLAEDAGRAPDSIVMSVQANVRTLDEAERFCDAGVDRLLVRPWDRDVPPAESLARFADDVLEPLRARGG